VQIIDNNEKLVHMFWAQINNAEFEKFSEIMKDAACIWLPNTREVFRGVDKYIEFNKSYPGRWFATVESVYSNRENVISIVNIHDENNTRTFFVTSVFSFSEGLICDIKEYWGDNGEPPQWRIDEGLSERY
jgi:hypothetical protein